MRSSTRCQFLFIILLSLIFGTEAGSQSPPDVKFPEVAFPDPPPPKVGPVTTLPADRLYVIESKTKLLIVDFPEGVVHVAGGQDIGKLAGRFVDGSGKIEFRSYHKDSWVYVVTAAKTGNVELAVASELDRAKIVRKKLEVVGDEPLPPPVPPEDDEMLRAIRKAYAATPAHETPLVPKLVEFYQEAKDIVKKDAVWATVYRDLGALAVKKGIAGKLKAIQDVIEPELSKVLPSGVIPETQTVTAAEDAAATKAFYKVYSALRKASE